MVRPIFDHSQNRSWEVSNMFKNFATTEFAGMIVHDL